MKELTLSLGMSLLMLLPLKAMASGTPANVSIEPSPMLTHSSLSKITVQYLDARYGIAPDVDVSGITLTLQGDEEILYALPDPSVDYSRLTLEFGYKGENQAVTVSKEGIYSLHIPDGAVNTFDTMSPLGSVDSDFTVSANATNEMSRYELTPAPGKVGEITTVAISFPDSGGLDWFHHDLFGAGDFRAITLSSKSDPSVRYTAVKKKYDNNFTVTLCFENADGEVTVADPGVYVLDIPANMFMKDYSDLTNGHISVEYEIGSPVATEFEGMISAPANGECIGRFSELSLTFPNMSDGLVYPVDDIASATLTTPSGEIFYGFSPSVGSAQGGTYNCLMLHFAPRDAVSIDAAVVCTEAGEYSINIPAGILKAYGKDSVNGDICLSFTIDPIQDFTYAVSPAADICHQDFCDVVFMCGNSLTSLMINPDCDASPSISLGGTSYLLKATQTSDTEVTLSMPEDAVATPGTWILTVPEMFFCGVNADGMTIANTSEITTQFLVKEPVRFDYSIDPEEDSTIEFFKNITIEFYGEELKEVRIDPEAGQPIMTDADGGVYNLVGRMSGRYVIFTTENGADIADGRYSVTIPQGYIITVDIDNLVARVERISTSLTIHKKAHTDYTDGILFLNEGWFGHDPGSLNFLGNNGEWTYDVFARNNNDRSLGITSQYGHCFGDRIYVVSKQSGGEDVADGGVFTVMDAASMEFVGQINRLPEENSQPRAFCAWDEHKGYLSTKDRIYTIDLDRMEVNSVVPGTDIFTSFDGNGEMLRYGGHIFAIRRSSGVDAIDPLTDDVVKIPAELASAFAVTPDGSLYVATRNESNEFVKISPYDLTVCETIDIPDDYAKIADVWTTWRKSPLAADIRTNTVYYVTQKAADESMCGPRTVARYDFDTKEFDEAFIKLPGVDDGETADWVLYGEGVSVDPASGYIYLSAVEAGYGTHYSKNRVFVADPATGEILPGRTHILEDAYWFPAMTLYPDFEAPVIDYAGLSLDSTGESFTLDVASATTLQAGNRNLINYTVESTDPDICTVEATDKPGVFLLNVSQPNAIYSLDVSADYQGKISTAKLTSGSVSVDYLIEDYLPAEADVYNLQGICVRRGASPEDVNSLPSGIYIVNGRRHIVR